MAILKPVSALLAALCLAGCVGTATNQAEVYKPVSGVLALEIKVPLGESFSKVQFQINDEEISTDDTPADGFTAELDTSTLQPDTLIKLAAVGVRPNGTTVVLRENYIRVAAQDSTATPEAKASGS